MQKRISDVNSFNNSINNTKEKITYFKDKNRKSKKKYEKYKKLTAIIKSFDTFVIIATTSSSIALSQTGIGLKVRSIATASTCSVSIGNEVKFEIIKQKCNKYKKQYEKDQQTTKHFDISYRKSLQDNVFDKNEYESFRNVFTKKLDERKNERFL